MLKVNNHLITLNISISQCLQILLKAHTSIEDKGAKHIADSLKKNKSLKKLIMSIADNSHNK